MAVSAYFHRNVFLLTQVIPTSEDFKKYFREGMFDKPNTVGFIHVSRYLLTIYDPERFKKSIQWPVMCKKTEAKYRNDVKNLLCAIAQENPDVSFPPILATYVLCASGTKFTTIMWKLSIVALRKYIKRECQQNVLQAPTTGSAEELTKKHFTDIIRSKEIDIKRHHRDIVEMQEAAKTIAMEEESHLNKIKNELFETKQSIMHLTQEAPVDPSIKNRLANIEDTEITKMWRRNLTEYISYIEKKDTILKNIETLSGNIAAMITSKINNTDGKAIKRFMKLNSFTTELMLLPDIQCLLHCLYADDKIVLRNFISLFDVLLRYLYQRCKEYDVKNLSPCLLQLEASCEDMNEACNLFQNIFESTAKLLADEYNLYKNKFNQDCNEDVAAIDNVFFPTPRIKIYTDCNEVKDDLRRRIELTPVESIHKSLFSRYKRKDFNNSPNVPQFKKNVLISRINFDDTLSLSNSEKSPQTHRHSPNINWLTKRYTGKYSRLFTSTAKENSGKVNCSLMSIPGSSKANSTTIPDITEKIHVSQISLNNTTKDLLHLSKDTKEHIFKRNENYSQECTTKDPIEVKSTKENEGSSSTNVDNSKRRCSISDLVQRYKQVLRNIDQTEICTKESDIE